jgi:hypothetical protein
MRRQATNDRPASAANGEAGPNSAKNPYTETFTATAA